MRHGVDWRVIFALVSGSRRPENDRKAYKVLRAMFSHAS
jgi:hypothetical protein